MPIIGTFKQQPSDVLDYDIDFSDWLPTTDSITTATVSVSPSGLGTSFAIQSRIIKVWCYNGTDGVTYKVTVTANTAEFRTKQVEFRMRLKEE